ncbi:hypothetical protein DFA_00496 [Cavenderia fasciculata]|uniref:TOG domain-containing protein n=1 Tax=Cavenderia fasciculata TaxID=261658 RepID=F4PS37_CACFS|nr:uncharacterized protein DFA_00496 [Cavenderia fasciculata]EGG20635.1 hypothetical protein DFA_00496 [Cavenderia fasciculata]|eukprot:XP_004358485.1 hypothetical protein DFA_00496 [Cavenderia fasciculata]
MSHLYNWLAQVEHIPLEEWTDSYDHIDIENDVFNPNYSVEEYNEKTEQIIEIVDAESAFERFVSALGERDKFKQSIYNQFNNLLTIQSHQQWEHILKIFVQQFPFILNILFIFVNNENIQVRWTSLQCLIQLSFEHIDLMVESRDEIFNGIIKTICDPNERVQRTSCMLIQSMIYSLDIDNTLADDVIDGLCSSFLILLQSRNLVVVEHALLSFMSLVTQFGKRLRPVMLENHQSHSESRLLICRAITAFAMCSQVVDKKTFSTYLDKLMVFVGKNEGSLDLVIDVLRQSRTFIKKIDKSFQVHLPMIIKMIVSVLEIPLSNQKQQQQQLEEFSAYHLLDRACQKPRDVDQAEINIAKCKATYALEKAVGLSKHRFSPFALTAFRRLDAMVNSIDEDDVKEVATE